LKLTVWHDLERASFLHFAAKGSQGIVDTSVVADGPLARAFPDANRVAITVLPACPPFENVKAKFCIAVRGHFIGSGFRGSGHNGLMSVRQYTSHHLRLHSVQSIS
jgi:hypothetical protein